MPSFFSQLLDLHTTLPLVCAIFVFILGVFVALQDIRTRLNQLFIAFCVAMVMWLFGTFMMFLSRTNDAAALAWDRFVYVGVALMPALMHHFSLVFSKSKSQRKLLVFTYVGSIFFSLASLTPYFVDGVYRYAWGGVHSQARFLHSVFLVFFYYGVQTFIINFIRYYRKTPDKETRQQIMYVLFSFGVVMFVGGTAYLMAYGIDLRYPFSYISGFIFPFMLFYAITKHHLLGKKVIVTEILLGAMVFFFMVQLFLSRSLADLVTRAFTVIVMAIMSSGVIRSVMNEVKRREEMEKLSHELEIAYDKLKEVDQAKTDFLSLASHQLRSPLTVIKVGLGALLDGVFGQVRATKQRDAMKTIITSADRLVNLIGEYLDISRIELGRMEYHFVSGNLGVLVNTLVGEYTQRAEVKGLKLVYESAKQLPKVSFDEDKMRQVITNLIDNAIKYTPAGTIMVRCAMEKRDGKNMLSVAVTDSGRGLSKEDMGLIFQKFKRASGKSMRMRDGEPVEGSGLGLYVAKMFVEAHKGTIWAESKGLGTGTMFKLVIPVA